MGPEPESPSDQNHLHPCTNSTNLVKPPPAPPPPITVSTKPPPPRLCLERSFSAEEDQQKCVECPLQPARVYTISTQRGMLTGGGRGSKESLELDVLKEKPGGRGLGSRSGLVQPSTSPSSTSSSPTQYQHASGGRGTSHHHGNHHHGNHHAISGANMASSSGGSGGVCGSGGGGQQQALAGSHSHHASHHSHHHHLPQPPLQTSVSAHNIRSWADGGKGEAESGGLACEARSQGSLDLDTTARDAGKPPRRLERMWSVDRVTGLERGEDGGRRKGEARGPNQGRGRGQSGTAGFKVDQRGHGGVPQHNAFNLKSNIKITRTKNVFSIT